MDFPNPPKNCAACETDKAPEKIEDWRDPIAGREYRVLKCSACCVVFSEPREGVGAQWYEKAAPLRLEEFKSEPEKDRRFQFFLSQKITPGCLLDVGCGDGGFLHLARDAGWRVAGFDYDDRVAAAARAAGLEDVRSQDFLEFVRARGSSEFDAVTLFDVLEHTPEPLRFLQELKRIIKPGGHIAITFPNALRPLPWGREQHDYPPHHFTRWTPEALKTFLENNDFDVVCLEDSGLGVYYLSEHLFYYVVMRTILPIIKKILFGASAEGESISSLYEKGKNSGSLGGAFKDKGRRHRWVQGFKKTMKFFLIPVAAIMLLYYRLTRSMCGEHLFALARLKTTSMV